MKVHLRIDLDVEIATLTEAVAYLRSIGLQMASFGGDEKSRQAAQDLFEQVRAQLIEPAPMRRQ